MVVEVLCTITLGVPWGVPISNHKIHNSGNYVVVICKSPPKVLLSTGPKNKPYYVLVIRYICYDYVTTAVMVVV